MTDLDAIWADAVAAAAKALWGVELADRHRPFVEPAHDARFGDATSGVPMRLARDLKKPPPAIAKELAAKLAGVPHAAKVEAAAGYVNFTADAAAQAELVRAVRGAPAEWGRSSLGKGVRVLVEHTSANPTGPMHIAHARQAAVGDSLVRILRLAGFEATSEFYVNDAGGQIANLGRSIHARLQEALGRPAPFDVDKDENAYKGDYIRALAGELASREPGADPARCAAFGLERLLAEIKDDFAAFRVGMDAWFSETALRKSGKIESMLEFFRSWGLTYAKDGATWLKSTDFGESEDRVLVKSDGEYTYRTPDSAYHRDKFDRGFDWLVDTWGPDHHAEIANRAAAMKALNFNLLPRAEFLKARRGGTPEQKARCFEVLTIQYCRLLRGGQELTMGKRAGTYVTLRELVEEVGVDAARWFFTMRKTDSKMDFDLDVAKKQTLDNPVYYAQYAHARICSITKKGVEKGMVDARDVRGGVWQGEFEAAHVGPEELMLLRAVRSWPRTVERAAENVDPSLVCIALTDLSRAFQSYYQAGMRDASKRVLEAAVPEQVRRARLAACAAVQVTLRAGFGLLGVSAPERLEFTE